MIHAFLLLFCILSVEILIKSNLLSLLGLFYKIIKKVIYVVASENISDHWKEKILLAYALSIMKYSLQILIIFIFIIFIFITEDYFNNDLRYLIFSFIGIIEALVFSLGYFFLRKSVINE